MKKVSLILLLCTSFLHAMEKKTLACKKQKITTNESRMDEDTIRILLDNGAANNAYAAKIIELNNAINSLIDHKIFRSNNQKNYELCHTINGLIIDMLENNRKMAELIRKQAKVVTEKIHEGFKDQENKN